MIEGNGPEWVPSIQSRTGEVYVNDFNGDRIGDLATLSPNYSYADLAKIVPNAGAVNIQYGSASGITTKRNQQLLIDGQYLQPNAFFGSSAATGNFDGNAFCDLVVGAYGAQFGGNSAAGLLQVILRKDSNSFDSPKILGGDRSNLFLGASSASGDFNGDGFYDIAAGAIGYKVNGKINAGAVYTYEAPDLKFSGRWTLASGGIKGSPKAQDFFGSSLFSADINNDGRDDLIIGSGNGNGGKGFANILYGGPNGLRSSGNQSVRLANGLKGDFFAYRVGACYCNDDDFADVIFTAPGYQKDTGAAFLIYGTRNGLSKTSSFFLQSPWKKEGDQFGYSIAGIGVRRMYTFAFGSPGAVSNGDKDAGRVDLFNYDDQKFTPFLVGGGNLTGRQFGKSLQFTADYKRGTYFLNAGAPGSTVSGKQNAGLYVSGRVNFSINGSVTIGNRKTFHLDKLVGTNQADAQFATGFAIAPLMRE
jgi:hypothetical protein